MPRKTETIADLSEKIARLEKLKRQKEQERLIQLGRITEKHLKTGFSDFPAFVAEVQEVKP